MENYGSFVYHKEKYQVLEEPEYNFKNLCVSVLAAKSGGSKTYKAQFRVLDKYIGYFNGKRLLRNAGVFVADPLSVCCSEPEEVVEESYVY